MIEWDLAWGITEWAVTLTIVSGGIAVLSYFELTPRNLVGAAARMRKPKPIAAPKPVWPVHDINPPSLTRNILGRDRELAELRGALLAKGGAAIVPGAVVQGQGGLGKSTLAAHYSKRFRAEYFGILWVAAENGPAEGICAAGPALGVPVAGMAAAEAAKAVLAAMASTKQPWLVIYDNVKEPQALTGYLRDETTIHLIVTTRQGYGWDGYGMIRAGMLDFASESGAAVKVLMEAAGRNDGGAEARDLAEALGGLPLALVVAGALIKESGEGFAAYRGRLAEIIHGVPVGEYPTTIFGAVKLSYDRLGADSRMVLDLFAWFAPEGLDARLLTDVPGGDWVEDCREENGTDLMALAADEGRVKAALRDLVRAALLGREGDYYALHRLTALAVRGMQAYPAQMARAAVGMLGSVYPMGPSNGPHKSHSWPQCRRLTPHVAALLESGEAPETTTMYTLLSQASLYLIRMAEYERSLPYARESLRIRQDILLDSHLDVALGHANLGNALRRAGYAEDGASHTERAVHLDEVHRPGSEELMRSYGMHGQVLVYIAGREREALRWLQRALALGRRLYGRWHTDVGTTLNMLGNLREHMGQGAAALRLHRANLTISYRIHLPDESLRGFALLGCGAAWLKQGRADLGEPLLKDALELREALHSSAENPDRKEAAGVLIDCLLTRAAVGENAGLREAQAKRLCAQYGFDFAERQARSGKYKDLPGGEGRAG